MLRKKLGDLAVPIVTLAIVFGALQLLPSASKATAVVQPRGTGNCEHCGACCTARDSAICLSCYRHCRGAILDSANGDCDRAVAEFRDAQRQVLESPRPKDTDVAHWAEHREWAPLIYGTAVAECYMRAGRYPEALAEFEKAEDFLKGRKDCCASAKDPCGVKCDFVSKVYLPLCKAECCLGLDNKTSASECIDLAARYLPGGDLQGAICPVCGQVARDPVWLQKAAEVRSACEVR